MRDKPFTSWIAANTCSRALSDIARGKGPNAALKRIKETELAFGEKRVLGAGLLAWIMGPKDMFTIRRAMLVTAAILIDEARDGKESEDDFAIEKATLSDKRLKWVWSAFFELGGSHELIRARRFQDWTQYFEDQKTEFRKLLPILLTFHAVAERQTPISKGSKRDLSFLRAHRAAKALVPKTALKEFAQSAEGKEMHLLELRTLRGLYTKFRHSLAFLYAADRFQLEDGGSLLDKLTRSQLGSKITPDTLKELVTRAASAHNFIFQRLKPDPQDPGPQIDFEPATGPRVEFPASLQGITSDIVSKYSRKSDSE